MPYSTINDLPDFDIEFEDDYIDECLDCDEPDWDTYNPDEPHTYHHDVIDYYPEDWAL